MLPLLMPAPYAPAPDGCWTLATYNVQDFFDATDDPGAGDECPSENQLRNKMTRLGRVLHLLDADIVALMEVETLGVLQRLNREYLADLGYRDAILIEGNDPERGIDVALLSRFPVTSVVSHAADSAVLPGGVTQRIFSRDCLECHVTLPRGEALVVLVNHFKSKRGGADETQALRLAQARRVREIAESLLPTCPLLVVAGDLNDTPASPTLQPLTGPGGPLADVVEDVPPDHRYTFVHQGQPERIDYVLASPALRQRLASNSVFIPHDVWAKRASDHDPIRATFVGSRVAPAAYPQSLTAAYDAAHPPVPRGHAPYRINAARFFARDLFRQQGQVVIVTGVVRRAERTAGTGLLRLFLGSPDPMRAFQVTIFPDARRAFADVGIGDIAGYYVGRTAQGVGALQFYQGRPEMAAETPRQFRVIPAQEN